MLHSLKKRSILVPWADLSPMQPLHESLSDKTARLPNDLYSAPMSKRACNGVTHSCAALRNKSHTVSALLLFERFNHTTFRLRSSMIPRAISLCSINLRVVSSHIVFVESVSCPMATHLSSSLVCCASSFVSLWCLSSKARRGHVILLFFCSNREHLLIN